jgi:hypothetical protein
MLTHRLSIEPHVTANDVRVRHSRHEIFVAKNTLRVFVGGDDEPEWNIGPYIV